MALANGLNANMLRRWVREAELAAGRLPAVSPESGITGHPTVFIPVAVSDDVPVAPAVAEHKTTPTSSPMPCSIPVEIRRGGTTVQASLPLDGRSAAWLREVLG